MTASIGRSIDLSINIRKQDVLIALTFLMLPGGVSVTFATSTSILLASLDFILLKHGEDINLR